MTTQDDLWLDYAGERVGRIETAFTSDFTWYGRLHAAMLVSDPAVRARLQGYIAFDTDWNDRCEDGSAEFEERAPWRDIERAPAWTTRDAAGNVRLMSGAPGFFSSGEISWLYNDEVRPMRQG